MTTFDTVLQQIADAENIGDAVFELPVRVGLCESDRYAARLLVRLMQDLGDDATVGDAEDVVCNALWWLRTIASMHKATEKGEGNERTD